MVMMTMTTTLAVMISKMTFPNLVSQQLYKVNRRSRKLCRKIVKSQPFYWSVILLVFLNTCVLTSEHNNQPQWLDRFQGRLLLLNLIHSLHFWHLYLFIYTAFFACISAH